MAKKVRLLDVGRTPYREVLTLQRELRDQVSRSEADETWIVAEHEPVITLGRRANREHILLPTEMLAAQGIDLVEVERGGDVTYHGLGQVVVYPIVKLRRFREVVPFVSTLEAAVVDALTSFGIAAHGRSEHRGVYVGGNNICAIGLAVKQMTTMHGLALNVAMEVAYDRLIIPCGMPALGITSVSKEAGRAVSWERGRDTLLAAIERRFVIELRGETILISG